MSEILRNYSDALAHLVVSLRALARSADAVEMRVIGELLAKMGADLCSLADSIEILKKEQAN